MSTQKAIISDRPDYALHLARNFQPDIDTVLSEGLACYGIKGAGKSNVAALLAEQVGKFHVPLVIFDLENEYSSLLNILPHGVLADVHHLPSGYDVLEKGLQVIINLRSWETDAGAALAMCQLISELRIAAANQALQDRVPCLLILDEAQYWLPQRKVSYLDKETTDMLRDEFIGLATRGRKLGLTPALFTQRISEINKGVVSQAGIQVLMRQTLDRDINRYFEYISTRNSTKARASIRAFRRGEALVCFPDGTQLHTIFAARSTRHVSNAPRVDAALTKFRHLFQPSTSAEAGCSDPRSVQPRKRTPEPAPIVSQIHAALTRDDGLSPMELVKKFGCDLETAKQARSAFFTPQMKRRKTGSEA